MIVGKHVILRGLDLGDADEILVHSNSMKFLNYSGRIIPQSKEECLDWIQKTWQERRQGKVYTFAIEVKDEAKLIGYTQLKILNNISRRADISIGIFNPNYRNRGLGTESLVLLIDYAFTTLNLLSLELKVFANNQRAIACYENLGFTKIGYRRKADYIEGIFLDDLMMDLLIEDWLKIKELNNEE